MLGLLVFGFCESFEVGAADKLFFGRGGVVENDDVNIIERSQLLLDNPDSVFALDADSLSMLEVHDARLGCSGSIHHPEKGATRGAEQ